MWTPDLSLKPSWVLTGLILLSHLAVVSVLFHLGGGWLWVAPLVIASALFYGLRDGCKCLPISINKVWLAEDGWHWALRNGQRAGPFQLHSQARVDAHFIRLSFRVPYRLPVHILLTAGMIGEQPFRQLQVFLRWAGDKNQPLGR